MDKGSISQIPVIRLFISIFEKGSTGVLYLKKEVAEGSLKVLYFNRGKFYSAISNADVDKLDNILLAKKLVNEFDLKEINEEENITESKGKILVEKGIITLEQLIECTKEQFKNIVLGVLKWNEGRFQFIEESLPEGLLNLDINILNFVFNYITQLMDISIIENQINSLTVKLKQNPDAEKLDKYNLNEKQKSLLLRFSGNTEVKTILSAYPEQHRDSILRIIYFFFVSELIIPTEMKIDSQSISKEKKDRPIYLEPKPSGRPDAFVFGKKSRVGDELPEKPSRPLFSVNEKVPDEKKRSKHFSYVFVFIIIILIIAGIIFILLRQGNDINKKSNTVTDKDIIPVQEVKPRVDKDDKQIVIQMKKAVETGKSHEEQSEKPEKKIPGTISEKVKNDTLVETPVKSESKPAAVKMAKVYFKEGDFLKACDFWKSEIKTEKVTHSILLELDCLKESVLNAYNRIDQKDSFFILKKEMGNRFCFLVFWGKFYTPEKASEALKNIPSYFWNQSNPPQVIDLEKYL